MRFSVYAAMVIMLSGFAFNSSLDAELLLHYNFESKDLEDATGNKNLGEVRGDPERVKGIAGMGLKFDGVDDYIFAADEGADAGPIPFMHKAFTEKGIAMWIKADDLAGTYTIFEEGGAVNGYGIRISAGMLFFSTRNSNNQVDVSANYPDTDWHHIAVVYKAGKLDLYIDSQEVATGQAPYQQVASHAGSGVIGGAHKSDAWGMEQDAALPPAALFQGIMDEFHYYDSAIDANEINKLYQSGAAVKPSGKAVLAWADLKSEIK